MEKKGRQALTAQIRGGEESYAVGAHSKEKDSGRR